MREGIGRVADAVDSAALRLPRDGIARVADAVDSAALCLPREAVLSWPPRPGGRPARGRLQQRWRMLAILSIDICVSYLPWYTFVPIMSQSMAVFGAAAADLNVLCILYSLVYVPGVFLSGTLLSALGCQLCFALATGCLVLGCALRCGPAAANGLFLAALQLDAATAGGGAADPAVGAPAAVVAMVPFPWLVAGQTICAVGQTFLVNATSEVAAEWFLAEERPAAAMISNLMNFIGGSLSFVVPTWYVSEEMLELPRMRAEVADLLYAQFKVSLAALALTVALYRNAPLELVPKGGLRGGAGCGAGSGLGGGGGPTTLRGACPRASCVLFPELCRVLTLRDFWLVNGQFVLYLAAMNTFDAIEGSLLATYGYSEALSSWTAISFAITGVLSTAVESAIIKHPAHYRRALIGMNGVLALSLLLGLCCLRGRMPPGCFVCAVGVMGFSTPGWGCSLEMGSEVCYPAREATVSSLLEAFGSLASVAGIVVAQRLIDEGRAAMVLVTLAVGTLSGGLALLGLSGRLRRREAEEDFELESVHSGGMSPRSEPELSGEPLRDVGSLLRQRGVYNV